MTNPSPRRARILVIDDNEDIHRDFDKILGSSPSASAVSELDALSAQLFGGGDAAAPAVEHGYRFEIAHALQGQDGYEMVTGAPEAPYAVAFVDMRMPPGWDGMTTIEKLMKADKELEVVLCTAFSDYSMDEIARRVGPTDRLLLLKKPFDPNEVRQLCLSLAAKWHKGREVRARIADLEQMSLELRQANEELWKEIASREKTESQLSFREGHDALTRLPNRRFLTNYLARCIERRERDPKYAYALLFVDIDHFKRVNATMGHDFGDELLVVVADRLRTTLRKPEITSRCEAADVVRLGADQFVVVLDGVKKLEDAGVVAETLLAAVAARAEVRSRPVVISASIGVATSALRYEAYDEILRDADTALARAKSVGPGHYALFEPKMHLLARGRLDLENNLRRAIQENQFHLVYQPIVAAATGQVRGVEALIRWQHPRVDAIAPGEFMSVAEETGLIVPLGRIAIERGIAQLAEWRASEPAARDVVLHLNVSPRQLLDETLPRFLLAQLEHADVAASSVALEIRGTGAFDRAGDALHALRQLDELGFEIHLDDFGTGYSTLTYLHELPLDALKIDRSFVAHVGTDPRGEQTVRTIVTLAHGLGLRATAVGVETAAQLERLREFGCDSVQGHVFGLELPPSSVPALLRARFLEPQTSDARG